MPTYEDIMLPFLLRLRDGNIHTLKELHGSLLDDFKLNEEERNRMLPSGRQNMFYNRLGWARTHLKKSLLIDAVSSGHFQITQRGLALLVNCPEKITNNFLMQYQEFVDFCHPVKEMQTEASNVDNEDVKTPREQMDVSYLEIQNALAEDLLQKIAVNSPAFFE